MSADGNNFGLNGCYEYNEFEIDSFDALQSNNTTYPITDWPRIYFGKPLDNIVAVKVLEATIPFTFYTINSTNNQFIYGDNNGDATVTVPPGTYTSATLKTTLESLLATASIGESIFTVTLSTTTRKLTISATAGSGGTAITYFQLNFSDDSIMSIGTILGGGAEIYTTTGLSMTLNYVVQLNGSPYLYLNSRSLGSAVNLFLNGDGLINASGTGADGPQICMIPVNAEFGENITYKDPDPQKWFYLGTQNIQGTLDFYLTHGTANEAIPLALNGAGFSLKLGLLQSKMTGNETLPSTQQNHRVTSRTWQAGSSRMLF